MWSRNRIDWRLSKWQTLQLLQRGSRREPVLNRGPTLMTWNACMFYGGLPMAFGGVSPAFDRIGEVATVIKDHKPEILALQEMSYGPALALYKQLKDEYSHFFLANWTQPFKNGELSFRRFQICASKRAKIFFFSGSMWNKTGQLLFGNSSILGGDYTSGA